MISELALCVRVDAASGRIRLVASNGTVVCEMVDGTAHDAVIIADAVNKTIAAQVARQWW